MTSEERDWLNDLLDLESGLSDWEIKFIDDLDGWPGSLTEKQHEKLQQLWEKHCN